MDRDREYPDDRDILFHLKRRLRERLEGDSDFLLRAAEVEDSIDVLGPHVDHLVPDDYRRLGLILAETPALGFPDEVYMNDDSVFAIIRRSIGVELMKDAVTWLEAAQQEAEAERDGLPEPTPAE